MFLYCWYKSKNYPIKKSRIYSSSCKECGKVYIGQKKKNLVICMKEYIININSHQIDKSTVAAQVLEWDHRVEEAKIN